MKITNIRIGGTFNILKWALENNADIRNDFQLASIINDETFFYVEISGINMLECFRLVQQYGEKIIIGTDQSPSNAFDDAALIELVNESFSNVNSELIKKTISTLQASENIIKQMNVDKDILPCDDLLTMMTPMLLQHFTIKVPVSYIDLVDSMNDNEYEEVINNDFPNTLSKIVDSESHSSKNLILSNIAKLTQIIKYDAHYDAYVKAIKYSKCKYGGDKLYKYGLLSFKTDKAFSLFNVKSADTIKEFVKYVNDHNVNNNLAVSAVIEVPIYSMISLENNADLRKIMNIEYRSSMNDIMSIGLVIEDFKTDDNKNVNVESYLVRLTEVNQLIIKTIKDLLTDSKADTASIFALIPPIYKTRAVVTFNVSELTHYIENANIKDYVIKNLITSLLDMAHSIISDKK